MTAPGLPPGTAPIKAEFLLSREVIEFDDDAAEGKTNHANPHSNDAPVDGLAHEPAAKKPRLSGSQKRKIAREEGKNTRGQNKGRRWKKTRDEVDLCWNAARGSGCDKSEFSHDIKAYLEAKPPDIRLPRTEDLLDHAPFVLRVGNEEGDPQPPTTVCPVFRDMGDCRHGFKCRFMSDHVKAVDKQQDNDLGLELVRDEERASIAPDTAEERNRLTNPALMKLLRTRKYPTPMADEYLTRLAALREEPNVADDLDDIRHIPDANGDTTSVNDSARDDSFAANSAHVASSRIAHVEVDSVQDVPLRPIEKRRLMWTGKTYLAPLTTVGNLPFRRLCVGFGADITCGEMGLATSFLNASKEEWSLVRRHPSEALFGVQIAGNKPATLVPTAEIIGKECPDIDFVDLNCGCPIDLVYKNGAGSALLDAGGKLGKIVMGMNRVLGDVPVTIKLRTGVKEGRNTVHKLMPRLQDWGVGAVTIHGRTRQQRYTKLADWGYIKQCVDALRSASSDEGLPTIPIFGGGDAFSAQGYWECVESSGVDGVMVARGALIKPWIFTEIKERREWDISSRERLDGIRRLCEFGLSHWGTDTAGVNTTRRYVCEALSFQHRYIPIGLLERMPGRLNDRAPSFRGRDELETVLASSDSEKWVEISSMFLGPPPEDWAFQPKHRSNSVSEEANG